MSGTGSIRRAPGPAVDPAMLHAIGGGILGPLMRLSGAIVVSVGPWIVAVLALAVISTTMTPVMGLAAIEDLRLTVVYAFGIGPLVAGPVGVVAARLIRAAVEERGAAMVPELAVVATLVSGVVAQTLGVAAVLLLGIADQGIAIGFIFLTTAAALLWTTFAALSALRSYRFLILAFTAGMALAVILTLMTALSRPSVELMIWSFTTGLVFCAGLSLARINARRRLSSAGVATAFWLLTAELGRRWPLALGILFAISSVWADKWVMWFGPEGMRSAAGFLHFSPWDSVMFVAHLSVIPSLAAMLLFQDGPLDRAVRAYRETVATGRTLATIRSAAHTLETTVWAHVFTIIFVQAAIAAMMILLAPLVTEWMGFSLGQLTELRIGILAVFLQAIFFFSFSLMVICSRITHFLWVQGLFLVANAGFSLALAGSDLPYAYGVFCASMIAAVVGFRIAAASLSRYVYLHFIGENESLFSRAPAADLGAMRAAMATARKDWARLAAKPAGSSS